MTWAKIDDQFHAHRKARKAWKTPAALGLHLLAISYCAAHLTDGVVDREFVEEKLPMKRERERVAAALVDAGLWELHDEGWQIHDWLDYNPSRADVERNREWDRRRQELSRNPALVAAIRERDGDRCRYCGRLVNWRDRRSEAGATYDHVVPRGPNSLENVVVACRSCNFTKGSRTPAEAGLVLLAAPGQVVSSDTPSPDPTRPDPTPNTPPLPPASGGSEIPPRPQSKRRRDLDEWTRQVSAFAAEHFPGQTVEWVCGAITNTPRARTADDLRPYLDRWAAA